MGHCCTSGSTCWKVCRRSSVKRRNIFSHFQRRRLEKGQFVCCHSLFPPSGNNPICRCPQIVCDHLFCTGLLFVLLIFYWRAQWSVSSVKKPQLNKTFWTCLFMRMGKLTWAVLSLFLLCWQHTLRVQWCLRWDHLIFSLVFTLRMWKLKLILYHYAAAILNTIDWVTFTHLMNCLKSKTRYHLEEYEVHFYYYLMSRALLFFTETSEITQWHRW